MSSLIAGVEFGGGQDSPIVILTPPASITINQIAQAANVQQILQASQVISTGGAPSTNLGVVPSGASPQAYTFTIPNPIIKALNTVPQLLFGAVAGKRIIPVGWSTRKGPWTNAYSANPSWRLRYTGSGSDAWTNITPNLGGTGFQTNDAGPAFPSLGTTSVGVGVTLSASADVAEVGDCSTNVVFLTVVCYVTP